MRFNEGGARHAPDWYDQTDEPQQLAIGDALFIRCVGGPCASRLEQYPPRLEVDDVGGIYVLVDDGLRIEWEYVFVPHPSRS
jgi:hypothetical protein